MIVIVKNIAIGSFEPDSSSSNGAMLFLSEIFLALSMAKTAAASVEEIMEPSKKASAQVKSSRYFATGAIASAVKKTPSVASAKPLPKIGLIAAKSVLAHQHKV